MFGAVKIGAWMSGFTKLFGTLVTSTIWREDDKTRIVWITMLALADRNGYVGSSIPGLAAMANVSVDECVMALEKLSGPDQYSRTPDNDGRRLVLSDGGWTLFNYPKYRELGRSVDRTEYLRKKQAEHRAKRQPVSTNVNHRQPSSTGINRSQKQKAEAEDREQIGPERSTAPRALTPRDFIAVFCEEWAIAYPGESYLVANSDAGQTGVLLKRLPDLSLTDWRSACARYVVSEKPFYSESRHPLRLLCASLTEFAGDPKSTSKLAKKTAENREMFNAGQDWAKESSK